MLSRRARLTVEGDGAGSTRKGHGGKRPGTFLREAVQLRELSMHEPVAEFLDRYLPTGVERSRDLQSLAACRRCSSRHLAPLGFGF